MYPVSSIKSNKEMHFIVFLIENKPTGVLHPNFGWHFTLKPMLWALCLLSNKLNQITQFFLLVSTYSKWSQINILWSRLGVLWRLRNFRDTKPNQCVWNVQHSKDFHWTIVHRKQDPVLYAPILCEWAIPISWLGFGPQSIKQNA